MTMPAQREVVPVAPLRGPATASHAAAPAGVVLLTRTTASSRLLPQHPDAERLLRQYRLRTMALRPARLRPSGNPRQPAPSLQARAARIVALLDRTLQSPDLAQLAVGLVAERDDAAPAVLAATLRPGQLAAIVLLDAGPDLTPRMAADLRIPTLLIVSGGDSDSTGHSRQLMRVLECKKRLEVVPAQARSADEPGVRQAVMHLAGSWLSTHTSDREPI